MNQARRTPHSQRKLLKKDCNHNDSLNSFELDPIAESKMGLSSTSLNYHFEKSIDKCGGSSSSLSFDLPKNYQNAVECLIQCDSIISTLEGQLAAKEKTISSLEWELAGNEAMGPLKEQLALKDKRISVLEEQMVRMSIDLANSKAFEDKHRSSRRGGSMASVVCADDDSAASNSLSYKKQLRGALDASNPSSEGGSSSDNERSTNKGSVMGVFQMFGCRKRGMGKDLKGSDDEKAPTEEAKDEQQKEQPEANGDGGATGGDPLPRPRFVPPNRRMTMEERQHANSRTFLEGVAFPTTHDSFSLGI